MGIKAWKLSTLLACDGHGCRMPRSGSSVAYLPAGPAARAGCLGRQAERPVD